MDSYPNVFDDLISKVKIEIKGSDPIPKLIENVVKENYQEDENYEDSGNQT